MDKQDKNWFARHKIISVVLFFFLFIFFLGFIKGLMGSTTVENVPTTNIKTTQTQAKDERIAYYFGDKVTVGNFAYIFHNVSSTYRIGNALIVTDADGVFLIFDVTIENIGKESKYLSGNTIRLIDTQERRFDADTEAGVYLGDAFTFEQMQPSLAKRGYIIFDIPKDFEGAIEISSDSLFSNEKKYVVIRTKD